MRNLASLAGNGGGGSQSWIEDGEPLVFDGFDTLNTKPSRPGIEDQQMYWCDNFMPLGKNNLRALPDLGSSIYTTTGGKTIKQFRFGNIGATTYAILFLSDGSIVAVNLGTNVASTIAAAGTITGSGLSTSTVEISQWGSQFILIVSPQTNGYFIWDGTLFYLSGTLGPFATILNGGLDYSSAPTITAVGGAGSGATFTSTFQNGSIVTVTPTAAGSGYAATDVVVLAFTGGGSTTTATATCTVTSGVVQNSVSVTNGGTGYNAATTKVSFLGGGGAGATGTVSVNGSGVVTAVTVTAGGAGYSSAPTLLIQDTANPVAVATIAVMPFGVQGSAIETFAGHVWIGNGSQIIFSAPQSVSDFGTPDGGGAFKSTDSFLRNAFNALKQSNGFLYLVGDSSVNYISGVSTSGSPATTTFSNQNVDPQTGTSWPETVQVYSRAIVLANSFGVHALYGGAVQKISAPLDGFYASVAPASFGIRPHAAIATVFGIRIYCLILPIIDLFTGMQRNALLMWDGTRWWTGSQNASLTQIASVEINSVLTAYGTDGTNLYPLFQAGSTNITKTVQSKLWDKPSYIFMKHATRGYAVINVTVASGATVQMSIDTERGVGQGLSLQGQATVSWTNNMGLPVSWTNNASQPVTWEALGILVFSNGYDTAGTLVGFTLQSIGSDFTIVSATMIAQRYRPNI